MWPGCPGSRPYPAPWTSSPQAGREGVGWGGHGELRHSLLLCGTHRSLQGCVSPDPGHNFHVTMERGRIHPAPWPAASGRPTGPRSAQLLADWMPPEGDYAVCGYSLSSLPCLPCARSINKIGPFSQLNLNCLLRKILL